MRKFALAVIVLEPESGALAHIPRDPLLASERWLTVSMHKHLPIFVL